MADKWIEREIARGMQALLALRLLDAPSSDTVERTLDVWIAAIEPRSAGWSETLDAPRIQIAFQLLLARVTRWPAPRELLDAMPARQPARALPAPSATAAQRDAARSRLAEMAASLATKFRGDR